MFILRLLLLCTLAFYLSGCGQSGPLFLPPKDQNPEQTPTE